MARCVWVFHNKAWHRGFVESVDAGKSVVNVGGKKITARKTYPVKHNGRIRKHTGAERIPVRRTQGRPPRASPPVLTVEAVKFQGPERHGDYGWQLQQTVEPYTKALHIYNENLMQQRDKLHNSPGGGNAVARPYRLTGQAIGIPTGQHGGYTSLNEIIDPRFRWPGQETDATETAKDTIDEAINEIVDHLGDNSDRFDRIYYCVNSNESDPRTDLIGAGIFAFNLGRDVRVYITDQIKKLPIMAKRRYLDVRRMTYFTASAV